MINVEHSTTSIFIWYALNIGHFCSELKHKIGEVNNEKDRHYINYIFKYWWFSETRFHVWTLREREINVFIYYATNTTYFCSESKYINCFIDYIHLVCN